MREESMREDFVYGRNNVMEALSSGREIDKILIAGDTPDGSLRKIVSLAGEAGIPVIFGAKRKIDSLALRENTQGVIAFVAQRKYVSIKEILDSAKKKNEKPFIVIADEIADPHNLGAIIRSADAFGAHGVIISKRRAVGLTASVEKASGGALNYVPVAKVANLASAIDRLKENGLWIYGSDMKGETPYYKEKFDTGLALVVGSEGQGMSRLIREKCDILLSIPMYGHVSCLNASVAAAVMMQEIAKYRNGGGMENER